MVYGLTGGIASGKSLVSDYLKQKGFAVIDCDRLVGEIHQERAYIEMVANVFGTDLIESGRISRDKLGKLIFSNADARQKLEAITHPLVFAKIDDELKKYQNEKVIIDMPLLFEVGYRGCEKTICVYTDYETRVTRLMARDSINREYAIKKIESQLNLDIKKSFSDYVIDNSGSKEETYKQVEELITKM